MFKQLTCINCPLGCSLEVVIQQGKVCSVKGNTCPRGKAYAYSEIEHPARIVTTSLPVVDGDWHMVSCKTKAPIPKEKIGEIMELLQDVRVHAPIHIGEILIENIANSNVDLVATREVHKI
ncbi:DUF1667 domain-containing protein [Dubosiella newyorkensis]|uniref:DUF1667 domain-containing protein n=1 Tax=Dubosiella newyorkensis TaxID=1862672 RepID=UPI00257359F9|nr:DUF1667 domain-containing protein [Dubosiella newyorkensis]